MSQTENEAANSPQAPSEEQIRKIYAKSLKVGESIHTVFKATRKERLASRAGKPYLVIGLVDRTGEVDARVFDNVDAADAAFAPGDYLLLQGKVGHFHGNLQVLIERLERLDPEPIDPAEFAFVPTEKPAKAERPEKKTDDAQGAHKAARQRLLKLLDNPQVTQALDVIVTHLERVIDERIAARLGPAVTRPDRPERKPKPARPEPRPPPSAPRPEAPRRDALPEGLAFKPFSQLVAPGSTPEGTPER